MPYMIGVLLPSLELYYYMRNFCDLIGLEQCGVSALFEIPINGNYKLSAGSINN